MPTQALTALSCGVTIAIYFAVLAGSNPAAVTKGFHMIHIAHKTLAAIKQAIEDDQGAKFRTRLRALMPLAEDAYRTEDSPFRSHLGASVIGEDCARKLWYAFHWTTPAAHDDRILRLFNRGHLEEPRFVAMLETAGVKVYQYKNPGEQFSIALHGGHFGGSLDGVAEQIPDITCPVLLEFKTHSKDSFAKLAGRNWPEYVADPDNVICTGEGVRQSKFQHYVQMQMYMAAYQLQAALYLAVCKDNDSLYGEIIEADSAISGTFANRAREIIFAQEPPARIKNDPSWYQCKFCDKAPVCYGKATPACNCRTCKHSEAQANGQWWCTQRALVLDKKIQLAGCTQYEAREL
jgi:hypothetical protein